MCTYAPAWIFQMVPLYQVPHHPKQDFNGQVELQNEGVWPQPCKLGPLRWSPLEPKRLELWGVFILNIFSFFVGYKIGVIVFQTLKLWGLPRVPFNVGFPFLVQLDFLRRFWIWFWSDYDLLLGGVIQKFRWRTSPVLILFQDFEGLSQSNRFGSVQFAKSQFIIRSTSSMDGNLMHQVNLCTSSQASHSSFVVSEMI